MSWIARHYTGINFPRGFDTMARPLRVEYPGAFYHVINRGNAGEDVFKSLRDREKFLEYHEA